MIFRETKLHGVYVVEIDRLDDDRGFFARTWCRSEFQRQGLESCIDQCSISSNRKRGTLRGMHYQCQPFEEVKLVSCPRGRIYDVVLDLRPDSPTYCSWLSVELTEDNHSAVYVPRGCAHGMQTLEDDTVVAYQIATRFSAEHARGVRWNDPAFGIAWPLPTPILSAKDRDWIDFHR